MMRSSRWGLSLLTVAALGACGGGGGGGEAIPAFASGATGLGVAPSAPQGVAGCPASEPSDVWIDRRLGCLKAGDRFIDISGGYASSTKQDTAYVLNQLALDTNFDNVLGVKTPERRRYWAHFLCVRNAPAVGGGGGYTIGLGADAMVAMRLNAFSSSVPRGVASTTIGTYSGGAAGVQAMLPITCNPAIHPLIVDYATGRVESVNPGALTAVQAYTLDR
jgi:hypothetical protein